MSLHELHPFCSAEIDRMSTNPGVYLLFQIEIAIHAAAATNLRKGLHAAKAEFPQASHFSLETLGPSELAPRVEQLRKQLRLVRAATFVGG